MSDKIIQDAKEACESTINRLGYELVKVTYKREEGQMCLTFYVYSPDGVDLNSCEQISNAIDPILEQADPTQGKSYCLCVSSIGDLSFESPRDYERHIGKEIQLSLKIHIDKDPKPAGVLLEVKDDCIKMLINNKEHTINYDDIINAKQYFKI